MTSSSPSKDLLIVGGSSPAALDMSRMALANGFNVTLTWHSTRPSDGGRVRCVKLNLSQVEQDNPIFLEEWDLVVLMATANPNNTKSFSDFFEINVQGLIDVVCKLRLKKSALLVHFSSIAIFETKTGVLSSNHLPMPQSGYSSSKYLFECWLREFCSRSSIASISLRLPLLICSVPRNNFLASWVQCIREGRKIFIKNPDDYFNCFVLSDDLAAFIIKLWKTGYFAQKAVVLGSSVGITLRELAHAIEPSCDPRGISNNFEFEYDGQSPVRIDMGDAMELGYEANSSDENLVAILKNAIVR